MTSSGFSFFRWTTETYVPMENPKGLTLFYLFSKFSQLNPEVRYEGSNTLQ